MSRNLAIPLVHQIHDQMAAAIVSGDLMPGDRLPAIRELAQILRINRDTVGQAYQLLESSGHVQTRAGGGTVVAGSGSPAVAPARKHELCGLVASAFRQAAVRGFTAQEFGQLAYYEGQRWACLPKVSVLVVHGYPDELELLRQAVTDESAAVDANGVLIDELAGLAASELLEHVSEADFVLAPVRLLEQVMKLLAGARVPVLGVGIGPSLATLVEVAKETSGRPKRVAVVCSDPVGAAVMDEVLRSAGVALGATRRVASRDPALRDTVAWADLVLVSDASADAVADTGCHPKVIRFVTLVSDSSLATARGYIEHVIQAKCRA